MKVLSWLAGILGIIIALVGIIGKLGGAVTINVLGDHAPSTFLILGILCVVVGIWFAVLGLQTKK